MVASATFLMVTEPCRRHKPTLPLARVQSPTPGPAATIFPAPSSTAATYAAETWHDLWRISSVRLGRRMIGLHRAIALAGHPRLHAAAIGRQDGPGLRWQVDKADKKQSVGLTH